MLSVYLGGNLRWFPLDSSRSASPMRGNPAQSRILDSPHEVAVASGFQAMEVQIPCQCNVDSGFQSFAGSLIIQAALQIPKPRTLDPTSRHQKIFFFILDSTSKDS